MAIDIFVNDELYCNKGSEMYNSVCDSPAGSAVLPKRVVEEPWPVPSTVSSERLFSHSVKQHSFFYSHTVILDLGR